MLECNICSNSLEFKLKYILDECKLKALQEQVFNPLSANPTKWSNTLKQLVGNSQRIV